MTQLSQTDNPSNIKLVKLIANQIYPDNPVLRDLTICQAILEAGLTKRQPSILAWKYNNLFGIKGTGTDGHTTIPTHEYSITEGWVETNQIFAKNKTVEDSLKQHQELLNKPRYVLVVQAPNIDIACHAVREAGYATDPDYPNKLLDIYYQYIEEDK